MPCKSIRHATETPSTSSLHHVGAADVHAGEDHAPAYLPRGTDQVLVDLGYGQDRAIDEIFVRMPTPTEVHRLSLGPGTPVAVHFDTGYTEAGRPVQCTINVLPGDRHKIVFERRWHDQT